MINILVTLLIHKIKQQNLNSYIKEPFVSSTANLVEVRRIELLTYALQTRRSPS